MKELIHHIQRLNAELSSLLPMSVDNNERLQKKFLLEFNYNSNHIEGNTLTYGETELLLIFGKTAGQHDIREYEEMQAHDTAYKLITQWAADKERPLSEADIKNLNKTILVKSFWKEAITPEGQSTRRLIQPGAYKEQPNSVRLQNGEIFNYTSPADTPIQMGELIEWWRNEENKNELHPVVLAAALHYKFVRIHPFDDGNGRISRLLMNYVLLKNNLPPVIIKSSAKKEYLFALNQADAGNLDAFIEYIAEQLIWSLEISIKAAKGEVIDEMGDVDKQLHLLKKKLGEAESDTIKIKFEWSSYKDLFEQSIEPLCELWNKKLDKFETFFLNRFFSIRRNGYKSPSLSISEFRNQLFDPAIISKIVITNADYRELILSASFVGLRKIDNELKVNAGTVKFIFHQNAYEVEWEGSDERINKLYHQQLTGTEMEVIVENECSLLLKNIEHLMKEK